MKLSWEDDYEIPAEIDLKAGKWIRNPLVQRFQELNLVSLADDVKEVFPDSAAVNAALRMVIRASAQAARVRAPGKQARSRAAGAKTEGKRAGSRGVSAEAEEKRAG